MLSVAGDGIVRVWDVATGKELEGEPSPEVRKRIEEVLKKTE